MTESTEWVTVKIKKPIRDQAQDDDRTYTEIMAAGLDREPVGNLEPFGGEVPDFSDVVEQATGMDTSDIDPEELASEVARRIDYAEIATKTAAELEGRMR